MEIAIKKNRIFTALLALALICTMAVPAFAAEYDTDVSYIGAVDPGTSSYTITVPASIVVDGAAGEVKIEGYTAQAVKITCANSVEMSDTAGNKLDANIKLADANDNAYVQLPISLTAVGTSTGTVAATWDAAPQIGTWSGNLIYNVETLANN